MAVTPTSGNDGPPITAVVRTALGLIWSAGPVAATLSLVLTILQGLIPALLALMTKFLIDALQAGSAVAEVLVIAAAAGVLGVAAVVLPGGAKYLEARLQRATSLTVQDGLFAAVNRFDGLALFENPSFLDRLRLAHQTAATAPHRLTASVFGGSQAVVSVGAFIGVLWSISPAVLMITLLAAVPSLVLALRLARLQADLAWRTTPQARKQVFYQVLLLEDTAAREVRLYGLGSFFADRMRCETRAIHGQEEALDRRELSGQTPLAALGAAIVAAGLVWIAYDAVRSTATVGDIAAYLAAAGGIQVALSRVFASARAAREALLLLKHYVWVVRSPSDLASPRRAVTVEPLRTGIELHDVWFRYGDGPWVLRGVNFTIPARTSVALVGLNGAGKSTIVKLLCRFYDPQRGSITWDGVDIREFVPAQLRERMSVVFQDYMTYDLPASENIGLGDVARLEDHERVEAAARHAGIDKVISDLPHGYDTMLSRTFFHGEQDQAGVLLSGGQWQRIALARALMRSGRDFMILDEPSSDLDAVAEQEIHDELRSLREGSTSLLISHRLAAVRRADKIVAIKDGVVSETGSHEELMALSGGYAHLFRLQASGYVDSST